MEIGKTCDNFRHKMKNNKKKNKEFTFKIGNINKFRFNSF